MFPDFKINNISNESEVSVLDIILYYSKKR